MMKKIIVIIFLAIFAVFPLFADWETPEIIESLLNLSADRAGGDAGGGWQREPVIYEDKVIFTAPSDLRQVGIAFAHENFANIYWFRRLLVPQDRLNAPIPAGQRFPDPFKDSGFQFYVYQVPENINELEYRLVINGLWTTDPAHSRIRRDPVSGLAMSFLPLPPRRIDLNPLRGLPNGLNFTFHGPPGEIVTVGGNFNNWDPFMYEMKEGPAGVYSINIPLPTGTYQYVFFHRGQRFVDPFNHQRIFARDGSMASEITVP